MYASKKSPGSVPEMSGCFNGLVVCQISNNSNNTEKFGKIIQASSIVTGSLVTKMSLDLHSDNRRNWKVAVHCE